MNTTKTLRQNNPLKIIVCCLGILLTAISAFIVICSVYLFVQFIVKHNTYPTIFGTTPQIIMTNDLSGNQPGHIESGDLVFIKQIPIQSIAIQNVVAYLHNGQIKLARVTDTNTNSSIQIDNANTEFVINENQILGIVTSRVANVGGFLYFTQTVLGKIIFICVPMLILLILLIYQCSLQKKTNINTQSELENKKELTFFEKRKQKAEAKNIIVIRKSQQYTNEQKTKKRR